MKMNTTQTVDEYLQNLPNESKEYVHTIRNYVLSLNLNILERISYGILTYDLNKHRIHIGGYKKHTALYPGAAIIEQFGDEVAGHKTGRGTLEFKNHKPLPLELIKKVIKQSLGLK